MAETICGVQCDMEKLRVGAKLAIAYGNLRLCYDSMGQRTLNNVRLCVCYDICT